MLAKWFKPLTAQHYVSPVDILIAAFDHAYPQKSSAQRAEIATHLPIFQQRDHKPTH